MKYFAPIFILGFFIFAPSVLAYQSETHAFLTSAAVDFYNGNSAGAKFPDSLRNYLIDGSIREDDAPRWLNHFYDPVFQRGLTYDTTIDPINIGGDWESSKEWANDAGAQNSFLYKVVPAVASVLSAIEKGKISDILSDSNFTWQRAIDLYKAGKKEESMFALGHVIHLIEDASVPDHTRNDPHVFGSPYETFAAKFTFQAPDTDLTQRLSGKSPVVLADLGSYFDGVATYSNNNFYSQDTIGLQSGYVLPAADMSNVDARNGKYYVMGRDSEGNEYPLLKKSSLLGILFDVKGVSITTDDELVKSSYWSLLSTKAVQYAAGVMDLFFKEVEAAGSNAASASLVDKLDEGVNAGPTDPLSATPSAAVKPTVFTDRSIVKTGETVVESGAGFTPSGAVVLYFDLPGGKTVSSSVKTDAAGSYRNTYVMPKDAVLGNYTYYAKDSTTGGVSNKVIYSVVSEIVKAGSAVSTESLKISTSTTSSSSLSSTTQQVATTVKKCSFDAAVGLPVNAGVILNEIAWMGGSEDIGLDASDEWVELKDVSSADVDISSWHLVDKGEQINVVFPSGTKIKGGAFYLLERGNDDTVPNVKADLLYSGALSNSNEGLRLFNQNCVLVDQAIADPNWPAGDAVGRRTMERGINLMWYTSGSDMNGIFGTPKKESGLAYITQSQSGGGGYYFPPSDNSTSNTNANASSSVPSLIINEIMYDFPGSDEGHEWIEIFNDGTSTADLSGVKLSESGTNHSLTLERGGSVLAEGGYAVFARDAAVFLGDSPDFSGNLLSSSFSLSNEGEEIAVRSGDTVIDSVLYSSSTGAAGDGNSLQLISGNWTWSKPTPGAANVLDQSLVSEEDTSGNESTTSPSSTPPVAGTGADHVVLSEMQVGGIDAGDEFIELYNPGEDNVDLNGWSLQYVSGASSEISSSTVSRGIFETGNVIRPKRFFLAARGKSDAGDDGYAGTRMPDLSYRSFGLSGGSHGGAVFLVSTTTKISSLSDTNIVDRLAYGDGELFASLQPAAVPAKGESLERKAFRDGLCFSPLPGAEGEFWGNGCGSGGSAVDFEVRDTADPQNFQSLPEPRSAPDAPSPFSGQSTLAIYSYDDMSVGFKWSASRDSTGSPSGMVYRIWEGASSSKILLVATTSLEFTFPLQEINKKYDFAVTAFDRDGMPSDETSVSVETPPAVSLPVIFSQNVLSSASHGSHYSDNWYELGRGFSGTLKAITLRGSIDSGEFFASHVYLKEFEDQNYSHELASFTLSDNAPFTGSVKNVRIDGLNIEFNPFSYYRLDTYQDYQNRSVILLGTEEKGKAMSNRFVIDVGGVSDYYTFYPFTVMEGEPGGEVDVSVPQKPAVPQIESVDFDELGMSLSVSWSASTDPDSLDSSITYEYNFTNLSDFNAAEWKSTGNVRSATFSVSFPNKYKIGVRAADDTGLKSDVSSADWEFPAGFYPYVLSNQYNSASQEFFVDRDAGLADVAVFTSGFYTSSRNPNTNDCGVRIENISEGGTVLIADSDKNPGDGESGSYSLRGNSCAGRLNFTFSSSNVVLRPGTKYRWTYYINGPGVVRFYGRNDNLAGGGFSGGDFQNAVFELKSGGETIFSNF